MKEFSFDINKEFINNEVKAPQDLLKDDVLNDSLCICKEIVEIFENKGVSMYEAFVILTSLADSIYIHSLLGSEEDVKNI